MQSQQKVTDFLNLLVLYKFVLPKKNPPTEWTFFYVIYLIEFDQHKAIKLLTESTWNENIFADAINSHFSTFLLATIKSDKNDLNADV